MDPTRLTASLEEAKSVIGGVKDTRDFVIEQLLHVGVSVQTDDLPLCYSFNLLELPANLRHYFKDKATAKGVVRISFASPTPKHYMYIGRNHTFVEDLSRAVVNDSVNDGEWGACRALVMETSEIGKRTTILLMRVRSVIRDKRWKTENWLARNDIRRLSWKIDNHDFLPKRRLSNCSSMPRHQAAWTCLHRRLFFQMPSVGLTMRQNFANTQMR